MDRPAGRAQSANFVRAQIGPAAGPFFHSKTRYSGAMLRCTVLASGSKGNCTIIASNSTRLMLDAGLSCRELVKRMRYSGIAPESIDGVLITHEHQDHVQGISVFARRYRVPVYFTQATHRAWEHWVLPGKKMGRAAWLEERKRAAMCTAATGRDNAQGPGNDEETSVSDLTEASVAGNENDEDSAVDIAAVEEKQGALLEGTDSGPADLPAVEHFSAGTPFQIGDIAITPFTVPHDAVDPVGFVLEAEGKRVAIATDLGYMPPNVRAHLQQTDLLILEANHDLEMLRDGPYPWAVKQRVLSRVGHLSNDAAEEFLAGEYDGHAQWIVLAHLSQKNNMPELARLAAERALRARGGFSLDRLLLATQDVPLESIDL